MLNIILADFYMRDIPRLIEEVNLFKNEETLWTTSGAVKNAAGNLVLHIIGGGTNHLIGATLAHTSNVCNRDQEFIRKGVARKELAARLEELIPMIKNTLNNLGQEGMEAEYPFMFDDDMKRLISYILLQLLVHLNYHLGQVNYLWRILE